MGPDPEPIVGAISIAGYGSIRSADFDREDDAFLRMMFVLPENGELLVRQLPDFVGQFSLSFQNDGVALHLSLLPRGRAFGYAKMSWYKDISVWQKPMRFKVRSIYWC